MSNPSLSSQISASARSSIEPGDASTSAGASAPEEAVVVDGSLRSCSSRRPTAISYECSSLTYFAALLDTIDSDSSSLRLDSGATVLHDIQGRLVEKQLRNGTIRPKTLYVPIEAETSRRRHVAPRRGRRRPSRARGEEQ